MVVKIPKWQFEKFPGADTALGTQMKSVGEVMAIGRTFKEALQKGIRSLEPSTPWRAPAETPVSLLREKLHAAAGPHSLAVCGARAGHVPAKESIADQDRSVVHRAVAGNYRRESRLAAYD